jgi:hypothetical protein
VALQFSMKYTCDLCNAEVNSPSKLHTLSAHDIKALAVAGHLDAARRDALLVRQLEPDHADGLPRCHKKASREDCRAKLSVALLLVAGASGILVVYLLCSPTMLFAFSLVVYICMYKLVLAACGVCSAHATAVEALPVPIYASFAYPVALAANAMLASAVPQGAGDGAAALAPGLDADAGAAAVVDLAASAAAPVALAAAEAEEIIVPLQLQRTAANAVRPVVTHFVRDSHAHRFPVEYCTGRRRVMVTADELFTVDMLEMQQQNFPKVYLPRLKAAFPTPGDVAFEAKAPSAFGGVTAKRTLTLRLTLEAFCALLVWVFSDKNIGNAGLARLRDKILQVTTRAGISLFLQRFTYLVATGNNGEFAACLFFVCFLLLHLL